MATTDLNITGRVGDITFYKRGDKTIIRLNEGISRHQIKNMPNMVNNRLNRREFVACSKTASAIYTNFNKLLIEISLKYRITKNNLVSLLRNIQKDFSYLPLGKRTIQIAVQLTNYEFTNIKFTDIAKMFILIEGHNNNVYIKINPFDANVKIIAPAGATHFRQIFSIITMNHTTYNEQIKNYNRPHTDYKNTYYSDYFDITSTTTLQVYNYNFPIAKNIIVVTGIAFYTESGEIYTNLYNGNSAKIIQMFNF